MSEAKAHLNEDGSATGTAMITIWEGVSSRFRHTASKLSDEQLTLKIGSVSIGYMVRHIAEVEYMFANWYFGVSIPSGVTMLTSRGPNKGTNDKNDYGDVKSLLSMLEASNEHIKSAISSLSEQAWHTPVDAPMGSSTPVEAIGRLIYHTGIHAGQISLIEKNA